MEKVVRVFKSFAEAEAADREYYRSLTPEQRMDLFHEFRKIYTDPPIEYDAFLALVARKIAG